jgi:hypothetical protein
MLLLLLCCTGLPDTKYEHLHAVLTAIKDGQPIPSAPGAALPAAPQPSTTPAATGSATPAANPVSDTQCQQLFSAQCRLQGSGLALWGSAAFPLPVHDA